MELRVNKASVAYDYSRFDNRRVVKEAQQVEPVPQSKPAVKKRATVSVGTALMWLVIATVSVFLVLNYATVSDLSNKTQKIKKQIETVQSENIALNAKLESLFDLRFVEEYAVNTLGMSKVDKSQIQYVQSANSDVVMVNRKEESGSSFLDGLTGIFRSIVEYFS